ncbi:MFS transporter [Nocardioides zeae]|uniref:MFS transporter n=1 Tax=Nocardioides imazamoxiresistens TaxID=3231893 RepID=A0ABU3PS79_9ACTN|nr:MFS transporter [Nocardioides zeae]MDT9592082.1 MFS transporter [Nocardioides zeae]
MNDPRASVGASPSASAPTVRRARAGVSLMFFTNGVLFAALLPRYPEIKAALGLSNAGFGLAVVAFALGSITAAAVGAPIVRRYGARAVTAVGSAALAAVMTLAGGAPSLAVFVLALFVGGAVDAVVDTAQNVHGVAVERWKGSSIINSLHATWSLGAATGGVIGAVGANLGIPLGWQMGVNGAVWTLAAIGASVLARVPARVEEAAETAGEAAAGAALEAPATAPRRPFVLLLPLVALAICGTVVEDVASNWVVLFLHTETAAPAQVATLGVATVVASQFVGRVLGDPMTDRWGRERVAVSGGLLIALGAALVVAPTAYPVAMLGFGLAGFGSATLVPAAFAAADRVPGLPEGTGIALVGWLMRLGFLLTSPLIGVVSQASSLRVALVLPLVGGLVAAGISLRARRAQSSGRSSSA